ncbi:hypothetical protein JCM6882_003560 [Rhodosporidiobolus microsporus]
MPFRMPPPAQHSSSLSPSPISSAPPTAPATLRLPAPPLPPKPLHLTMSVRGRAAAFENGGGTMRGTVRGGEGEEGGGKDRSSGGGRSERGRRPGMPRWSVAGDGDDGDDDDAGGTIKAKPAGVALGGGEDEEQEAKAALAALGRIFADDDDKQAKPDELVHREASASTASGGGSGIYRTPVGTLRALNLASSSGSAGSSKRASTIKVRGKDGRLSIFFNATRENPFVPPFPEVDAEDKVEEEKEDDVPLAPPSASGDTPLSTPSPSPTPPSARTSVTISLSDSDSFLLPLPATTTPAVALHGFTGEPSFGELSFSQGVELRIEVEDLGGGWSLGFLEEEGEEGRGLIPRGWYAYVDVPAPSPPTATSPSPAPASTLEGEQPASGVLPEPAEAVATVGELVASPEPVSPPALPSTPPEPVPFAAAASPPPSSPPQLPPRGIEPTAPSTPPPPSPPTSNNNPAPGNDLLDPEPASPYPTRSIGRHVVVSGIEFEPIPGTPRAEEEGFDYSSGAGGGGKAGGAAGGERELSVEELLRREEEGAFEVRRSSGAALEEGETANEEKQPEEDGLLSLPSMPPPNDTSVPAASSAASPVPTLPLPHSAPSRPLQASGSILFRLGLTSSPSSSSLSFPLALPLSLPLPRTGRSTIPGATVLAATGAAPPSPPRKKRLPRAEDGAGRGLGKMGAGGGKDALVRWIEMGDELDEEVREGEEGVQVWDVEAGPSWRPLSEPFIVHVHSPVKLSPFNETPYTAYSLTTVFASPPPPSSSASSTSAPAVDEPDPASSSLSLTVLRRYSHFSALHSLLTQRFFAPLVIVPDLPPKVLGAARFSDEAVEQRRRDLERWLGRLVRHPVVGESEELRGFLAIEGEKELLTHLLLLRPSSPAPLPLPLFPARVFHPAFNVDLAEAEELGDKFERWCRATEAGGGVREVERAVGKGREAGRAAANDLRALAHSLIRLVAGLALPPPSYDQPPGNEDGIPPENESEVAKQQRRAREWGLQNGQGGMGWKEEDGDALCLAKAVQASAEAMANIADGQNEAMRNAFLGVQELLHEHAQPLTQYSPLIELHRTLLTTYRRLSRLSSDPAAHDALARCETALNVTCAEMERVRVERNEDVKRAVEGWVDAAVEVQEQTLAHLRYARDHFSPTSYPSLALTGPRLRSPLEAFSSTPVYPLLPQPTTSSVGGAVAAVGSVLLSGAGGGGGAQPVKAGLRRAQTVSGAIGAGRRAEVLPEEDEEEDEGERGELAARGVSTWRDSIFGGTMRLWQ